MAGEAERFPESDPRRRATPLIVVSVGTFQHGFDELVVAADAATRALGRDGFAQIGHSGVAPLHLAWERFVPHAVLQSRLRSASLVVCHGGAGILGEAMRASRPIVAVPRRGETTRRNPANDQTAFLTRVAERFPIHVCADLDLLEEMMGVALDGGRRVPYALGSDVPDLVASFLMADRHTPRALGATRERPVRHHSAQSTGSQTGER